MKKKMSRNFMPVILGFTFLGSYKNVSSQYIYSHLSTNFSDQWGQTAIDNWNKIASYGNWNDEIALEAHQIKYGDPNHQSGFLHPRYDNVYYYNAEDFSDYQYQFNGKDAGLLSYKGPNTDASCMIKYSADTVSIKELKNMFSKIKNIGDPKSNYSYLNIIYGFDESTKQMKAVFQPIVLTGVANLEGVKLIPTVDSYYYKWNSSRNDFDIIKSVDEKRFESTYQKNLNLYFNDDYHMSHRSFIDADDASGDAKSAIMPMQQIIKMFSENGGDAGDDTAKIEFVFVSTNYTFTHSPYSRIGLAKIHVAARYVSQKKAIQSATKAVVEAYAGNGADYSQLCPTQCPSK